MQKQIQQEKNKRHANSSLESKNKIHKKITDHIKDIIRQNNSKFSQKGNTKAEHIPEKIIQKTKQTHKYLYKKTLINTKFQWLNKYLQSSELQSLSMNINSNKINLKQKQYDEKQNRKTFFQWRINKRSKTQGFDCQKQTENFHIEQFLKLNELNPLSSQNNGQVFRQKNMNRRILSENYFRLKKSKSSKNKNHLFQANEDQLQQILIKQRQINCISNSIKSIKNSQNSKNSSNKQNIRAPSQLKHKKVLGLFIQQNTPVKQFLQCTARLNSSNLMLKNKSGYIKNRKRQYIYQSRQQKRQQSQLLKIKKKYQEDITVQPWNLGGGNQKQQNDQNDFIMNKHR